MTQGLPKQPHDACECAWCELHRLPEQWRVEATYSDRVHSKVRVECADQLQQLLDSADVLSRGKVRR